MPGGSRVVVVGDVIDDIVVRPGGPIRPDTDTASEIRLLPGGSAANTAAWLATGDTTVTFVGRCGVDDVDRHTAALEQAGVRALVTGDASLPTGRIVVIVDGATRTMLTQRGANAALDLDAIDVAGADLVHTTGYGLGGWGDAFPRLLARAHAAGARVSLNIGSVAVIDEVGRDRLGRLTAGVDILIANAAEAALLTGRSGPPHELARALASVAPVVAVTAGADGAVLRDASGSVTHVAAVPAAAVDPTGAGDAFAAGLLLGLVAGEPAAASLARGARLAARAVARTGGRPPLPALDNSVNDQ